MDVMTTPAGPWREKEWAEVPGWPYLYVNVQSRATQAQHSAAYRIEIELVQRARIERTNEWAMVTTWSTGGVGYGDAAYALLTFKDLMDKFLNAWLSVNPKGGGK
jgi:hypothetical protein